MEMRTPPANNRSRTRTFFAKVYLSRLVAAGVRD